MRFVEGGRVDKRRKKVRITSNALRIICREGKEGGSY
jgi:ribosomal protein L28